MESERERGNLEDLGIDKRIIIVIKGLKTFARTWTGFIEPMIGSTEHKNKPLGLIKGEGFTVQLVKELVRMNHMSSSGLFANIYVLHFVLLSTDHTNELNRMLCFCSSFKKKIFLHSTLQLLVAANVCSSMTLVTLMMEATPKHWFLQEPHSIISQKMAFFSHCHENLKS
jgi:hypothetical protein